MRRGFCFLIFLSLAPVLAAAEGATGTDSGAGAGPWQGDDVMEVRLISASRTAGDTPAIEAGLEFRLKPGWKVYWRSPGDGGLPPVLDFSASGEITGHHLDFPAPERFSILGFESFGYSEGVILPLRLERASPRHERAGRGLARRGLTVAGRLNGLVCSDICIPVEEVLTLTLPPGKPAASDHARAIAMAKAQVPGPGTAAGHVIAPVAIEGGRLRLGLARGGAAVPFNSGDVLVEAGAGFSFSKPVFRGGVAELEIAGGDPASLIGADAVITVITPAALIEERQNLAPGQVLSLNPWQGIGLFLLIAFIGGVILNAMPCVLPVLSLKLAAVLEHGGDGGGSDARGEAAGGQRRDVRGAFLATAAGVVSAFVLLGVVLLVLRDAGVAIGWGIQFQHPSFLITAAIAISFFGLVMLDVIRLPVPAFARRLKGAMPQSGFVGNFASGVLATLLATPCSAPFVGTAITFALAAPPAPLLMIFAVMGLGLALPWILVAIYPGAVAWVPRPGTWLIWLKRVLAVGLFATAAWLMSILLTPSAEDGMPDAGWQAWQAEAVGGYVAAGRVVLVDVTADWCITCQTNKAFVLDNADVRAALEAAGVIKMQADWTRPDDSISRYLASFGRYGIPFNVVYGPAAPGGIILPELLTRDAVQEALTEAKG